MSRSSKPAVYGLLAVVSFALWAAGVALCGKRLFAHDPADQNTLQALSWLQGRADLQADPDVLELAEYQGRLYDSFPPTPTLVQLPLVLLFGRDTPTGFVLYLFCLAAILAQYEMALRRGCSPGLAALLSLGFVFGTNLYSSLVQGGVWAEGQVLGYCFAILGLGFVLDNPRPGLRGAGTGYLLLSLAVGCRPFYALMLPFFAALDRASGRKAFDVVRDAASFFAPFCLLLAAYNGLRFGNPLEFGHAYLPWSKTLPHGVFSFYYLPRNLFHTFLELPKLGTGRFFLKFDGRGTAFWLNNPLFVVSLLGLRSEAFGRLARGAAVLSLGAIWFALLLHESNGWFQFGYRYLIDLLPIAFVLCLGTLKRPTILLAGLVQWSFLINLYGIWWQQVARVGIPE